MQVVREVDEYEIYYFETVELFQPKLIFGPML